MELKGLKIIMIMMPAIELILFFSLYTYIYLWFGIISCIAEFIHLVSSEANEICNRQMKKTILPEHVFQALQVNVMSDSFNLALPALLAFNGLTELLKHPDY